MNSTAPTSDASAIAADLIATMPAATSSASTPPPPPEQPGQTPAAGASGEKDSLGRVFDATKFRPKKDTQGRWINVNGGRKPGPNAKPPQTKPAGGPSASFVPDDTPPPPPARPPTTYEIGAATLIGLMQAGLISLGQEEGILSEPEKTAIADPLEKVLRKYDAGEMPPELALVIAAASIVLPRLAKPKTQTSVQKIRMWLGAKFAAFKGRKIAQAVAVENSAAASS